MKALFDVLETGDPAWDLALSLDPSRLPNHIAVIMDGNGRWARQRGLPRVAGHKAGIDPVRMIVETGAQLGIGALTLYAFSAENWKRPAAEVDTLWRLLRLYLQRELPRLQDNGIRLNAIGRWDALSPAVRDDLGATIALTSSNKGMRLNLAINYSGRTDLVDAMNRLLDRARRHGNLGTLHIDEEKLAAELSTAGLPDPDLLIRTSGEMRISNFLLWQIAYSELYVTETLWPDFDRVHFLRALLDFQRRDRRFGGVNEPAPGDPEAAAVGALARK
jgi:undecaprenyl diphosphate synthase